MIYLSQITLIAPVKWQLSDDLFSSIGFGAASLSSKSGVVAEEFIWEFTDLHGQMEMEWWWDTGWE